MNDKNEIQDILDAQIEAFVSAGIDPAKIYATAMTDGLMPTEENLQHIPESDFEEWGMHCESYKDHMGGVRKLLTIATKNPDYSPEDEQYIAGVYFGSLVAGLPYGADITDCPDEQYEIYDKAVWIYDKIQHYEMKYHRHEIKKRMKLI